MTEKKSTDLFHLIYAHYNFIHIFSNNEKYMYKPFGIFRENGSFVLKFDIVETNTIQNESGEDYRIDTIFNEEPRIYETWQREPSSFIR